MTGPAALARALVDRVAGDEVSVVRVLTGVARGRRLALDLTKEKAYWIGSYERVLQRFLGENVGADDVFYDVGAHIGFFSVCAASLGARVVAVEPDPANASRLRMNASLNGLAIEVVEAAAWHETGRAALVPGGSAKEFRVEQGEGVASVALDDLARRYGAPTVVKLDVEGAEARVLAGARHILAESMPVVVCELHGVEQAAEVPVLLHGYRVTELGSPDRIVARRGVRSAR